MIQWPYKLHRKSHSFLSNFLLFTQIEKWLPEYIPSSITIKEKFTYSIISMNEVYSQYIKLHWRSTMNIKPVNNFLLSIDFTFLFRILSLNSCKKWWSFHSTSIFHIMFLQIRWNLSISIHIHIFQKSHNSSYFSTIDFSGQKNNFFSL